MPADLFDHTAVYNTHGLTSSGFFRRLTSPLRMRPSLFIVGAQKAGTTSLAAYLSSRPGVIGPWEKEIGFFNNDDRYALGEQWYSSFFPTRVMASFKKQG